MPWPGSVYKFLQPEIESVHKLGIGPQENDGIMVSTGGPRVHMQVLMDLFEYTQILINLLKREVPTYVLKGTQELDHTSTRLSDS